MTVIFQNKGVIDLRAVRTIGLNAKPGTDNPIGEFGTGLKLAIAVILREGGTIRIFRGTRAHEFGFKQARFRGEDCRLVTMDGQELGFTLNYGRNWKPWQAFRELYSNMLDEPEGTCRFTTMPVKGLPGHTTITVDGAGFDELYEDRRSVFLEGDPLLKVPGLEVHYGQSKALYYNNMRAMDLPHPSLFTYNVTSRQYLTEDRTFMLPYHVQQSVVRSILQCDNAEVLAAVLRAGSEDWESRFEYNFDADTKVSGTFMRVAADLRVRKDKMSSGALKLFSERATLSSTYGMARTREPTPLEVAYFQKALDLIRRKLPGLPELPCVVANGDNVKSTFASQDSVELVPNFMDMTEADLAAHIVVALCNRSGSEELPAVSVARMFILGGFQAPVQKVRETVDDLPF